MIPYGLNPHGLETANVTFHVIFDGVEDATLTRTESQRRYCYLKIPDDLTSTYGTDWKYGTSAPADKATYDGLPVAISGQYMLDNADSNFYVWIENPSYSIYYVTNNADAPVPSGNWFSYKTTDIPEWGYYPTIGCPNTSTQPYFADPHASYKNEHVVKEWAGWSPSNLPKGTTGDYTFYGQWNKYLMLNGDADVGTNSANKYAELFGAIQVQIPPSSGDIATYVLDFGGPIQVYHHGDGTQSNHYFIPTINISYSDGTDLYSVGIPISAIDINPTIPSGYDGGLMQWTGSDTEASDKEELLDESGSVPKVINGRLTGAKMDANGWSRSARNFRLNGDKFEFRLWFPKYLDGNGVWQYYSLRLFFGFHRISAD